MSLTIELGVFIHGEAPELQTLLDQGGLRSVEVGGDEFLDRKPGRGREADNRVLALIVVGTILSSLDSR